MESSFRAQITYDRALFWESLVFPVTLCLYVFTSLHSYLLSFVEFNTARKFVFYCLAHDQV